MEEGYQQEGVEGGSNSKSIFLIFFKFLIIFCLFVAGGFGVKYLNDNYDFTDRIVGPNQEIEDFISAQESVVKLLDLESPGSPYTSGEPIFVRASLEADTLNFNEVDIELGCELTGYEGDVMVDPSYLMIPAGISDFRRSISCSFDQGLYPTRRIDDEVAKITASFQTEVSSSYDLFIMSEEAYDTINDPFLEYGILPENMMGDGRIQSEVIQEGPVIISIFIDDDQPFRQGEEYLPLEVSLVDTSRSGYISFLSNLRLKVPSTIELSEDPNFCDFESGGSEGTYNIYSLKMDSADNKINEICNDEHLNDLRISKERCVEEYKQDIVFKCDLITKQMYSEEGDFVQNILVAESEYIYEVSNSIGLQIQKI